MLVLWLLLVLEGTVRLHVHRPVFCQQLSVYTKALYVHTHALMAYTRWLIPGAGSPSRISQHCSMVAAGTQYDREAGTVHRHSDSPGGWRPVHASASLHPQDQPGDCGCHTCRSHLPFWIQTVVLDTASCVTSAPITVFATPFLHPVSTLVTLES